MMIEPISSAMTYQAQTQAKPAEKPAAMEANTEVGRTDTEKAVDNTTVVIKVEAGKSSSSIKISGLKVGASVTVTEDTTYNRDYSTSSGQQTVTLSADSAQNKVTISNSKSNEHWLSESGHMANLFKK